MTYSRRKRRVIEACGWLLVILVVLIGAHRIAYGPTVPHCKWEDGSGSPLPCRWDDGTGKRYTLYPNPSGDPTPVYER